MRELFIFFSHAASLAALEQLYASQGKSLLGISGSGGAGGGSSCVIPIADIRGSDSLAYEKGEKLLRCKLASVYRLIDLFGWSQSIYNHITVSGEFGHEI